MDVVLRGYTGSSVKDARDITPAEFEIMEVLWPREEALSVGQVLQVLAQRKSVAYTTVMTLLDKLARKGSVHRVKQGKAFFYQPSLSREEVLDFVVSDFVDSYCGGEKGRLFDFLDRGVFPSRGGRSRHDIRESKPEQAPRLFEEPEDMDVVLL